MKNRRDELFEQAATCATGLITEVLVDIGAAAQIDPSTLEDPAKTAESLAKALAHIRDMVVLYDHGAGRHIHSTDGELRVLCGDLEASSASPATSGAPETTEDTASRTARSLDDIGQAVRNAQGELDFAAEALSGLGKRIADVRIPQTYAAFLEKSKGRAAGEAE